MSGKSFYIKNIEIPTDAYFICKDGKRINAREALNNNDVYVAYNIITVNEVFAEIYGVDLDF